MVLFPGHSSGYVIGEVPILQKSFHRGDQQVTVLGLFSADGGFNSHEVIKLGLYGS